ncbi:alpha/beta fold hydrolase [Streptomyces polyrhachis]|uniref:Alpha/beta fold hydrolase n=1 Tax=Streptomyces polyrhachis TaxID=1282885 RepID=A0ABW2GAA7_9ACTN
MHIFTAPDGTELAYHVKGRGEPLICLPGGPMRASAYLEDLGGLDAHRRLILLDLRGTGKSAVPEDPATYRCDRQTGDVEALRVHLGLERVDLLAHSAGSNLALLYALAHPARVRRMALLAPALRALGQVSSIDRWREHTEHRAGEPWYPAARAALERIAAGADTDEVWDAVGPFFFGRWTDAARRSEAGAAAQVNEAAAEVYYEPGTFDVPAIRTAAAALPVPVLLLSGAYDWNPRPSDAQDAAALLPGGRHVLQPGAVHMPWVDDGPFVARQVESFLAE